MWAATKQWGASALGATLATYPTKRFRSQKCSIIVMPCCAIRMYAPTYRSRPDPIDFWALNDRSAERQFDACGRPAIISHSKKPL